MEQALIQRLIQGFLQLIVPSGVVSSLSKSTQDLVGGKNTKIEDSLCQNHFQGPPSSPYSFDLGRSRCPVQLLDRILPCPSER